MTTEAQPTGADNQKWNGIDLSTVTAQEFADTITQAPAAVKEEYVRGDQSIFADMHKRWETEASAPASASQPGATDGLQQLPPAQPGASAQPAQQAPEPAEEMVDLTGIKIPKNLFGTYLVNRKPDEALLEALKGNFEKDKTIKTFIERNDGLSSETLRLQQQLLDATVKAKTAEAQPKAVPFQMPQFDIDSVDLDALEKIDFLDPVEVEQASDKFKKLVGAAKTLKQQAEAAKAQPSPAPTEFKAETDPEIVAQRQRIAEEQRQRNIFEIDTTTSQMPQMAMTKPFKEVDTEVGSFLNRIAMASGINDTSKAAAHYFGSTPEATVFRESCARQGIVPPPDYDKHQIVYRAYLARERDVSELRDDLKANPPPRYSMRQYIADEYARSAPSMQQPPASVAQPGQQQQPQPTYQERIEQHNRQAQANSTPPGYIPDIPPSVGSQSNGTLSPQQQDELAARTDAALKNFSPDMSEITPDEARWLVANGVNHSRILARSKQ